MPKVQILTPAADNARFSDSWKGYFDTLTAPLLAMGMTVSARDWTLPLDPDGADLILPLLAWGYHHRPDFWFQQIDALEAGDVPVLNVPDALRWNSSKRYLLALAEMGVAIMPTLAVDAVTEADLDTARSTFDCDWLVVKPQISAGSEATLKLRRGDALIGGPRGPALIQPFFSSVTLEGELSLFYFGGQLSHAIRKQATGGDFRVQPQFGGVIRPLDPPSDAVALAEAAMSKAPDGLLYARIDLLRGPSGALALMELEAIEPDLYFEHAPDRGAMFAATVAAYLRDG
jgi:glutathione synthase/RimK-type ligase-like ATP-grasp enzyme